VKKARAQRMRALGARKKSEFCSSFLGRRVSVLVEEKVDDASGFRRGFSRNYLPVILPAGADAPNREVDVELNGWREGWLTGIISRRDADLPALAAFSQ
jgi:threonylcarbamoyladenosine tRNA methylthiotransferase MtaB